MKFFGWVQGKFNGKGNQQTNATPTNHSKCKYKHKDYVKQEVSNEEGLNDWSHGLLTIGTFGTDEIETPQARELPEFTAEEVGSLQQELTKLLKRKPAEEEENAELPLDRFLNCPSTLEVSRRISNVLVCADPEYNEDDDIESAISVIIGKCRKVRAEKKKKKDVGKESLSFLLKKMFVCSGGFAPAAPSLRDQIQESRLENLLRTIVSKKVYSRNTSRASSMKRFIESEVNFTQERKDKEDQEQRQSDSNGSKWDKTDSEYIVLEI